MFCVECGKEGKIVQDGLCLDCYIKKYSPFFILPKTIDLQRCVSCGAFRYKNSWLDISLEKVLEKILDSKTKTELKKLKVKIECKEKQDSADCIVTSSGYMDDFKIEEKHKILVRKIRTICQNCSRKAGGYFEAILQLRGKVDKEIIRDVEELIEREAIKGRKDAFISKIKKTGNGVDFYIGKKEIARNVVKRLHEKFGGEVKTSPKLAGVRDGRRTYRMTYLLRLPEYRKGDFVKINGRIFLIKNISGKKISILNLTNWEKKSHSNLANLKIELVGRADDVEEAIVVSETESELQIMLPKSYEVKEILKPKQIKFNLKTVKIFRHGKEVFLIPGNL